MIKNIKNYYNHLLNTDNKVIIAFSVLILITIIVLYSPSVNGSFVYDDSFYITDNNFTKDFSSEGIQNIWSNYIFGNYNPATITSLALDYKLFGETTTGYHIVNILLHFLTTILILFFTYRLSGNLNVALLTSILFAVHPIHVESVSWISGRKDLLFTFFFMLSLLYYLKYLKSRTNSNYTLLTLFLILSCLSKAVAVVLPVVLILIDFYNHRIIDKNSLLEKVPFFMVSMVFGLIAIDAQSQAGALRIQEQYGIIDKILLSIYSTYFYIEKLFVPLNLSANYPFPKVDNGFSSIIYFPTAIVLIVSVLVFLTKKYTRKIIFSALFCLVTVLPVLQFVAVGNAITADRFAYLPSFAFLFIIAVGHNYLFGNNKDKKTDWLKKEIVPLFIIWFVFLGFTTYNRSKVWENEFTLFSDMIDKNPAVALYYNNLGLAYLEKKKDYKKAKELFEKAISLKSNYSMAYNNLGNLYSDINKSNMAISSYLNAIKTDTNNAVAFNNIGTVFLEQSDINSAIIYLNKAVKIDKNYFDALNNYANALIANSQFNQAEKQLKKALLINRKAIKTYINFGILYAEIKQPEKAEEYLLTALEIDPDNKVAQEFLEYLRNSEKNNPEIVGKKNVELYNEAVKLLDEGNFTKSELILKNIIQSNPKYIDAYSKLAVAQTSMKKYEDAIKTFNAALLIQPKNAILLKNMAVVYQKVGNMKKVIESYQKAARIGDLPAQEWLNLNGISW